MATPVVTPPAAAPAAAPAPAAPAAAVPTPAPAAPATPAAPTTTPELSLGDRISQGWDKAKESVNLEDGTVKEPEVVADPAPVADPAAVPEVKDDAVPVADPAEEEFKLNFDEEKPAPAPDEFAKTLTAEQQAFFDANPDLKNLTFGALRRDAENREIRQYVPDVATAQELVKNNATWEVMDNHFLEAATTENGSQKFLDHWVNSALIVGDDGKPLLDDKGMYQVHESLPKILDHITNNKIKIWGESIGKHGVLPQEFAPIVDALGTVAKSKGDERLQAAVDVIREAMSPSSPAEGEVPDELKPYATSLKAKEEALNKREQEAARRDSEGREAKHYESIERAEDTAGKSVQSQLKPRLEKAGLNEDLQTWALQSIGKAIDDKLGHKDENGSWVQGSHPTASLFQSRYDSILRQGPGPEMEKALQKLILSFTNEIIGPITTDVIRKATAPAVAGQTTRQTKVDEQTKISKSDPRGTSGTSTANTQVLTDSQLRAKLVADYKASNGGAEPDRDYMIRSAWEHRKKEAAGAAGQK